MKLRLLLASLWLCEGCVILAGKADYGDYRMVRLAPDSQARSIAMQRYVERHPTGHWHDEIQRTRSSEELATFEAGKDTRAGLEHYLLAFPDGQFVAQARGRLSAIALIEQRKARAERQAAELAEARKARTEELRRTWVGRFIGYWAETLTGLHAAWGEPIAEVARANPRFSRAFAAQPRPRCTQDDCLKYYTSQFAVPVPGGNRIERTLSLVLRLRLKNNKLERAELLLPDRGFSRWYELENRRSVADGDAEGRAAAVEWALQRTLPIVNALGEGLTPTREKAAPSIERPAIGPTGELIDTSIEAPSDPQNRAATAQDNAGIGTQVQTKPEASISELVKPSTAAAPDMVFAPVGVSKQGQTVAVAPAGPAAAGGGAAPSGASGEIMIIDPVAVPRSEGGAVQPPPPAASAVAPSPASGGPLKSVTRGFQWSGLHLVLFAAGSDGDGYDGLIIERAAPLGPQPRAKAAASKPAAPVATQPAAH
jgi:hypothetical protein